jgi:hypothetical protein
MPRSLWEEAAKRRRSSPAMTDQSHREEMNAAIRAQRKRQAAPRTIAPEPSVAVRVEPAPLQDPPKTLFQRLRGK